MKYLCVPWAVFCLTYVVFLLCLHPAFQLGDSPETVATCYTLGVQHMPGYPLMTLLGKIAASVQVGSVYFRINLLVVVLASVCCVFIADIVRCAIPNSGRCAAGMAGLCLAFSGLMWDHALTAKGGIYMLNLVFILLIVCAIVRSTRRNSPFPLLFVSLCLGVGMSNHWMSMVMWLPALLLLGRACSIRLLAIAAAFFIFGASMYLQLPFSTGEGPMWGDPRSFQGLKAIILRQDFVHHAFQKPPGITWLQLGWNILAPVREGGLPFVIIALAGIVGLWKANKRIFLLLAAGAVLTLVSSAVVTNPIHQKTGTLQLWASDQFLLPWLCVFAIGFGVALEIYGRHLHLLLRGTFWTGAAAVVVWLFAVHLAPHNHSQDYVGYDYMENVRHRITPPALVFTPATFSAFPLLAMYYVERRREFSGLIFINPHLERPWGWKLLGRKFPQLTAGSPLSEPVLGPQEDRIVAFAEKLKHTHNLYHGLSCKYPTLCSEYESTGLLRLLFPKTAKVGLPTEETLNGFFSRFRLRGLFSSQPYKDRRTLSVLDDYVFARSQSGERARMRGDVEGALRLYEKALQFPGYLVRAGLLKNVGLAWGILGDHAQAEAAFLGAARIKPHDLVLWKNAAIACSAQGKYREALRYLRYVLKRRPDQPEVRSMVDENLSKVG